ncbi:CPBP family intramembrane glutamic endopeptidase [Natronococcus occultus]|uniref:Putative metal-dependent membrane protease n=1 Tax=Natronococcus occultus SP4 TaxID=694430 RepID=L0K2W7_9EURY|nr:type II CAAX endopeptidase family protein [Natronococcus occultus]AGB38704.1 putative metal-dependent membrane protease [Natronococcus occultus SP4]
MGTGTRSRTDRGVSREDVARRLENTVEPLADCSLLWSLTLPLVPIAATALVMTAGFTLHRGADPGWPDWALLLPLGGAYVAVLAWLYWRWDRATWRAAAVVRRPSGRELASALVATAVGIGIVVAGNAIATSVDLDPHARAPVTDARGIAALLVATVVIAPIAEEVLFRGLVLGHLLARGYSVLAASALSIALFALIHAFMAGPVSILITGALGTVLTGLRLRYDSLVGPWLMHVLINAWGVMLTVGLLPALW